MQEVSKLSKCVKAIQLLSNKIRKRMLEVMSSLVSEDNDYVDDFIERFSLESPDKKEINVALQQVSLELVKDAEVIYREMPFFSKHLIDPHTYTDSDDYPFLHEVWCGDIYGDCGLAGLLELKKEMKQHLVNANSDEYILDEAQKKLCFRDIPSVKKAE